MRLASLSFIILVASFAVLFHSAVFAAVCPNEKEVSTTDRSPPVLGSKHRYPESAVKERCSPEAGQFLPPLYIEAGGEISVTDNQIFQRPWSSKSFESKGKVQLVQYIAANRGASRQNKPFTDTLIERRFSSDELATTVIVNMVDTLAFAKGYIVKRLAKSKAKYETINFVIDDSGAGLQRWGMKHKSYAIIVLDANGKVLFAKDGPLSEMEIENTIELIESHIC